MLAVRAAAFVLTAGMAGGGGVYLVGDATPLHLPSHHAAAGGPGCSTAVGKAVCRVTDDPRVRTAMLLGALLEAGQLNPDRDGRWPVGDHGAAYGPWQLHGHGRAVGESPARAAAVMLPRYQRACASVAAATWRLDRRGAAAVCVFRAERPAAMYPARRVADAWAQLNGR